MKRRKKLASASRVSARTGAPGPLSAGASISSPTAWPTGGRFRILTIVDNVSRVSPAIEVGASLTGERVVAILERLTGDRRTTGAYRR